MLVNLWLRNYRNMAELDLEVEPAGFAVIGKNGHGKSNLLEAISYLRLLRSNRGSRDSDLVRFGEDSFSIRAHLSGASIVNTVGVAYENSSKRKRAITDGVVRPRLSDALASLQSVSIAPSDTVLVSGGPSERRRFLDITLALTSEEYLTSLQNYRSVLARRNASLRAAQRSGDKSSISLVSLWEPALCQHGSIIIQQRRKWVSDYSLEYSRFCEAIGETDLSSIRYACSVLDIPDADIAHELALRYEDSRLNEIRRGVTLIGPHRDDFILGIGGKELRTFGSAGQHRTASIALRLCEASTIRSHSGHSPLLLLDDPFAELDNERSSAILRLLEESGMGQTVIAVPRPEDVPQTFTFLRRYRMDRGVLVR